MAEGEYWPTGPGKNHLERIRNAAGPQPTPTPTPEAANPVETPPDRPFRREDVLESSDEEYPYYYPIDDIYDWYKEATW